MAVLKPLPCDLSVGCRRLNATGECVLVVVLHIKVHTQLSARLAGATFANDSQRCTDGFIALFNQGLVANSGCQIFFKAGDIDHPVQRFNALLACLEI